MNFDQNLKAFLRSLTLKKMSGHQKFLAVAALESHGKAGTDVSIKDIRARWMRTLLKVKYNPSFYDRAQREGWVNPPAEGKFSIDSIGLEHLVALEVSVQGQSAGELKSQTHL